MNVAHQEAIKATAAFAVPTFLLLVLAGFHVEIPSVREVASGARLFLAVIAGLVVLVGGGTIVLLDVLRGHPVGIVSGVVVLLLGLTLVGISVGIPAPLQVFVNALQLIIDALNGLIHFMGGFHK